MLIKIRSKSYIIFLLIVLLFSTNIQAQKKIKVHAKGKSISLDKTPKDALRDALKDAKENALKKAGITELISVSRLLFEESSINDYKNHFNEISSVESNANIFKTNIHKIINFLIYKLFSLSVNSNSASMKGPFL